MPRQVIWRGIFNCMIERGQAATVERRAIGAMVRP